MMQYSPARAVAGTVPHVSVSWFHMNTGQEVTDWDLNMSDLALEVSS